MREENTETAVSVVNLVLQAHQGHQAQVATLVAAEYQVSRDSQVRPVPRVSLEEADAQALLAPVANQAPLAIRGPRVFPDGRVCLELQAYQESRARKVPKDRQADQEPVALPACRAKAAYRELMEHPDSAAPQVVRVFPVPVAPVEDRVVLDDREHQVKAAFPVLTAATVILVPPVKAACREPREPVEDLDDLAPVVSAV